MDSSRFRSNSLNRLIPNLRNNIRRFSPDFTTVNYLRRPTTTDIGLMNVIKNKFASNDQGPQSIGEHSESTFGTEMAPKNCVNNCKNQNPDPSIANRVFLHRCDSAESIRILKKGTNLQRLTRRQGSEEHSVDGPNSIKYRHSADAEAKGNGVFRSRRLERRSTFTSERPMVLFAYTVENKSNEELDQHFKRNPTYSGHGSIKIPTLTSAQLNLIRLHWKQTFAVKGPTVLGMHIFQRACFKCPSMKDLFKFVDFTEKAPNVDASYKNHATSIGLFIDDVVKHLDDLRSLDEKIYRLGYEHAKFYKFGLLPKFFDVFAEAFIDCTLEWGEKMRRVEEARKAWAITVAHVLDRMKAGFIDGRREIMRNKTGKQN